MSAVTDKLTSVSRASAAVLLLACTVAFADPPSQSTGGKVFEGAEMKTIIGPTNPYAADGVEALREGDAERALPLLQKGLKRSQSDRDFVIGLSNICAAYVLVGEPNTALTYCDRALEMKPRFWRALNNRALAYLAIDNLDKARADIELGLTLAPQSLNLKKTSDIYERIANPVEPLIIIDDTEMTEP